ncbi:c-type cytochrome [soil metagenome]
MSMIKNFKTVIFLNYLILIFIIILSNLSCKPHKAAEAPEKGFPQVFDERLELSLFAEDPDIVTPIGIAIDDQDRIFVLESHTHQPPKDYEGPNGDLVKIFKDNNGDGKPDEISVFAQGFKEGLNLAFSPEGILYLVTSREVWALFDRDGDGKSEEQKLIIELAEPEQVYAHAALLGVTFSHDGWMYISRGNTGGANWKMVGSDGSSISGYGDGGNIVRARPDGSQLEEVATGFWNPIDIKFDDWGRLFTCDNDPDSRGPNRLVHIVPGGDFGYKSLYGGSGIHPYLAWNGELPHTLPFAVGLGEAPSGLLNASVSSLPSDYQGEMLCTIWEESRIVRIKLDSRGASVGGETEVIMQGDQEFRPVAFATDNSGTIYFTDWVLRDYPNHGRGRIWRLSTRPGEQTIERRNLYDQPLADQSYKKLQKIYSANSLLDFELLRENLISEDPFLRHAAIINLSLPQFSQKVKDATNHSDPKVRLGALTALHRSESNQVEPILRQLLADPDEQVRRMALISTGKKGLKNLKPFLDQSLTAGAVTPELFETYLETVRHLQPEFIKAYRNREERISKSIKRPLPSQFIENFIADDSRPSKLRALALRHLEKPSEQIDLLTSLLSKDQDAMLRLESIRSLATIPNQEVAEQLLKISQEPSNPTVIRAEALLSLSRQPGNVSEEITPLLKDPEEVIQIESARYLRSKLYGDELAQVFKARYATLGNENEALHQQVALAIKVENTEGKFPKRPSSLDEWQNALDSGGDPQRGRRVFYSVQSLCSSCHAVQGRGGDLGPDLSNAGQSKTRPQLVHSILRPSEEISPEWQGWYIKLKDGKNYLGRQIDVGGNDIKLYTEGEGFISINKKDIEDYGMIENSLMPEGLEARLTVADLQDLLSFLESEK